MDDLRTRLYWLMGLRLVVVTLLLGLSIAFDLANGERVLVFFYALIAVTYALTILYAGLTRYLRSATALTAFAYSQIGVDLILETLLVAVTGATESPFIALYVITVSLASLIPTRGIGLASGAAAVLSFGLATNIQVFGLLEATGWVPASRLSTAETFQAFGVHGLAVVVVGFLSSALAEQLRRKDETILEKERGFTQLQAFHESIVQSINSGVFTTDEQGRITSFNRAAYESTGLTPEQVLARPWQEVFTWRGEEGATGFPMEVPSRFEIEEKRGDGTRMVLGMTITPLSEGGVQKGWVGVFRDLTQIREMEEEMRRHEWLATLGEMSAGMAHEIRNPLGALVGAMQMLKKDQALEETNQRLMDIAVREATRLDGIIKEFLQYARPPALNLNDCDLNQVLAETLDLVKHEGISHNGITIKTEFGQGPMTATVDRDKLKQVFWNLATNALQAMTAAGQLTVSTACRQVGSARRRGEVIEVTFRDTGVGIKKEDLDKIFLPFYTTKKEGSGLGLAAIDRIVDLHGGWIRVESQEGKGTLFAVCLPRHAEIGPRPWHEGRGPWKKY